MNAVAEPISPPARAIPLTEAVDLNPRPDRGSLPEDLDVSFVPMAAVEAATGRMDATAVRRFGEVKKGYTVFREGDVLFAKITPCMENGKMAVARGLRNGVGCGSTEFHVLRARPCVDPHYLYHFISSAGFRAEAAHHMTGAVGQKRVPATFLEQCEIPLPELDEQRRIVAEIEKQFSRVDEAVATLKRVKANLARHKLSMLVSATSGRLLDGPNRSAAESGIGENITGLPTGWRWAEIGDLANVVRGGSPRPAGDPRYFGGSIPWITVGPITADDDDYLRSVPTGLTDAGRERSRYIEPHTLLLTNSGATLGVPKISLTGGCINDGVAALLNVDYPLKKYLLIYLRCKTAEMRRVNQGAAQPNLNTTIIKRYRVPVPPTDVQHRIVAEVDRRLSIAREVEAEVDAVLKRAQVLRSAVSGRAFGSECHQAIELADLSTRDAARIEGKLTDAP